MFKKLTIYFLLINFFNTVIFQDVQSTTPVVEEINSIFEYVTEVLMGIEDPTPEDEDDDIPDSIKSSVIIDYIVQPSYRYSLSRNSITIPTCFFYQILRYNCILEINSPPPKLS